MPRFRVPDYIRTTFAVSDWRAFRLCGMDEVGRGAYAGPLVAAAVVLPQRFRHPLLRDSKLLSAKQRELVGAVIRERSVAWAVAEVSVEDINARGLGWANVEIFRRLVDAVDADGYCCDGNLRIPVSRPLHSLVAGDRKVPAVSAASITRLRAALSSCSACTRSVMSRTNPTNAGPSRRSMRVTVNSAGNSLPSARIATNSIRRSRIFASLVAR